MKKSEEFYIRIDADWYKPKDILITDGNTLIKVIDTPRKNRFWKFIEFITFGLCKASIYYKCKIIKL